MNQFLGLNYAMPLTVDLIDDTRVSNTLTLSKRFLTYGVSFWRFTIPLEFDYNDDKDAFEKLKAHIAWHKSGREFNINCPQTFSSSILDTQAPAPIIGGEGNQFVLAGTDIGNNSLGRFIKINNRGKLYKVVAAEVENNQSKLLLYPEISPAPFIGNNMLLFNGFTVSVVYDPNGDFSVSYDADGLVRHTIVVDENV